MIKIFFCLLSFMLFSSSLNTMDVDRESFARELATKVHFAHSMDDGNVSKLLKLNEQSPLSFEERKILAQPQQLYALPQPAQFSPDGRSVAYLNGLLHVADAVTGRIQQKLKISEHLDEDGDTCVRNGKVGFGWSPHSKYIVVKTFVYSDQLLLLNLATSAHHHIKPQTTADGAMIFQDVVYSPSDRYYMLNGQQLIDAATHTVLYDRMIRAGCYGFSPDEKMLLIRCWKEDDFFELFDIEKKAVIKRFRAANACFAPDMSYVVYAHGRDVDICVYNLHDESTIKFPHNCDRGIENWDLGFTLRVSRDSKRIACLEFGGSKIFDPKTGRLLLKSNQSNKSPNLDWLLPEKYKDMNYSPDGNYAVAEIEEKFLGPKRLVLCNESGDEHLLARTERSSEYSIFPWDVKFHPTGALIMHPENAGDKGEGSVVIKDCLLYQNVSLKELCAYRVIRNALKESHSLCPAAVSILQQSNNQFLQQFIFRYINSSQVQELHTAEESQQSAASAAAAMTM